MDWQRPGFRLGLAIRDLQRARPDAHGVVLGGHGLMTWADTGSGCEARSCEVVARAEAFLADRGTAAPFGPINANARALPATGRAH